MLLRKPPLREDADRMEPDGNTKESEQHNDQSLSGPKAAKRVTVQEAAEALGITVVAVRARIKRGKLRRRGRFCTTGRWDAPAV